MRYETLMKRLIAARMLKGQAIDVSTVQGQMLAKQLHLTASDVETGAWQERAVELAEEELELAGRSQLDVD